MVHLLSLLIAFTGNPCNATAQPVSDHMIANDGLFFDLSDDEHKIFSAAIDLLNGE